MTESRRIAFRTTGLALVGICAWNVGGANALAGQVGEAPPDPFGWFGELAGACWSGVDPAGQPTDRQCYERQYGHFVRGTIEIFAGSATGKPAYAGDSVFAWDAAAAELRFDFWSSRGQAGRGTARYEGAKLVFPPADEGDAGRPRIRSIWERIDPDSFRVVRERAEGNEWRELLVVVYRRDGASGAPPSRSPAPAPGGPLEPFAFLADSCWLGTFADGKTQDENCFEWTLGGGFLRSRHRVIGGEGPYQGETLFGFDPQRGKVTFVYWNSAGGVIRGEAEGSAETIEFPSERVEMGGKSFELRSTWRRQGSDRYRAETLRRDDGEWAAMMRIEFVKLGAAPAQAQ